LLKEINDPNISRVEDILDDLIKTSREIKKVSFANSSAKSQFRAGMEAMDHAVLTIDSAIRHFKWALKYENK